MSLATRINALGTRVAAEIRAKTGGPTYAYNTTSARPSFYDRSRNVYNLEATNTRKTRSGMVKALGGGKMDIVVIGDSMGIGFDGTSTIEANSFPRRLLGGLSDTLGVPIAGTGFVPVMSANNGSTTDRWTVVSGTMDNATYLPFLQMSAGAVLAYQSILSGPNLDILVSDNSGAFTVAVDGATPVAFGAGAGSGTTVRKQITGLSDGPHRVVITATAAIYLAGVRIWGAVGVEVHNLSYGGSTAAIGAGSWTDTSSILRLSNTHKGSLTALGISPDLIIIQLGGNDAALGDITSNVAAGITAIRNWYPNADVILTHAWEIPGTSTATWNFYSAMKYDLAESLDCPLIDWRDRVGQVATAVANGWTGSDGIHPKAGAGAELGRSVLAVVADGPRDKRVGLIEQEYDAVGSPAAPSTGIISFIRNRGRKVLATQDSLGHTTELQSSFTSNRIERMFVNAGLATTVNDGMGTINLVGAFVAQAQAVGNAFTTFARARMTTAATAGGGVGWRTTARYLLSTLPNVGGGYFTWRGGIATPAAGGRAFIGLSTTSTAISTTTDPSLLTSLFGFAVDAGDTNWQFITNDASGTATKVSLGANFPAKTTSTDWYDFRLFVPSGGGQRVYWSALRIDANGLQYSAQGQYVGADMPALNTLLAFHEHFGNGSTAAAASIDFQGAVFEFDN